MKARPGVGRDPSRQRLVERDIVCAFDLSDLGDGPGVLADPPVKLGLDRIGGRLILSDRRQGAQLNITLLKRASLNLDDRSCEKLSFRSLEITARGPRLGT